MPPAAARPPRDSEATETTGARGSPGCRPRPLRAARSSEPAGRPLRTSSMRTSGFSVLVFFRHWMIFPGMAPTYVRLWGEGTAGAAGASSTAPTGPARSGPRGHLEEPLEAH